MADNKKRYYWIKMMKTFFDENGPIDYLMSKPNGSEYVVLYIKLWLTTVNNNNILASNIGDMLIPYDAEKIQRDSKYFSIDTVYTAMRLFEELRLMYVEDNGIYRLSCDYIEVGSYCDSRNRVNKHREEKKEKALQCNANVTQISDNRVVETDNHDDDVRTRIHAQIDYQYLYDTLDVVGSDILHDVVADMIDVYTNIYDHIKIKSGESYPAEHVRARYDTIDVDIMMHIIERLRNANIGTDARAYIRTTTYNATKTIDTQYNADARHGR